MKKKIVSLGIVLMLVTVAFMTSVSSKTTDVEQENEDIQSVSATGCNYYAVLAACADYKGSGSDLPIQEFKLTKLYRGLISNDNWKDENIILLVNDNPDPSNPGYSGGATKANIVKALGEMANKVKRNDVFLFSWQGHGSIVPESETSGLNDDFEADGYDEVICPWDCERDNNNDLINYISDDDLDSYFSLIKAKGMMLIFESCFSGGLVASSKLKLADKIFNADLNAPDRIICVSTLDGTLGRGSWIFGFPMTWTLGDAFDKNSLLGGPADSGDGTITAEDAFGWARPKIFVENSIIWAGIWTLFFFINFDYQKNELDKNVEEAIKAALEATAFTIYEFCLVQLQAILMGSKGMINIPQMIDRYNPLIGGKELIIVDNREKGNNNVLEIPALPEIWNKPEYSSLPASIQELYPDYEEIQWFNWKTMNKDSWPPLQAKAEFQRDISNAIHFRGQARNGPEPFTYNWVFSDKTTSTDQNPTYTGQGGTAELTITDGEGRTASTTVKCSKSKTSYNSAIQNILVKLSGQFPLLHRLLNL